MNLIEIVHAEGTGLSEPVEPGDRLAVEAGDRISLNVALVDVTSIARMGDDLYLTILDTPTTVFDGFFTFDYTVKPLTLNFTDVQLNVVEVKNLFDLSFDKIDSEGNEQIISLRRGSMIPVAANEIYQCDAQQYDLKNIHRVGDDLFLMSSEHPDQAKIILHRFFVPPELGAEPPQLQLTDPKSGAAADVLIHPKSAVFGWQGDPLPQAVEGVLYAYYFKLEGADAENFSLSAAQDRDELPRWLSFGALGKGEYLLWGIPPREAIGTHDIEIYAHSHKQNLGLHTQQAFPLAIRSANDTTTRPAVDDVGAAEFRKLEAQFAGESYGTLMSSETVLPYMSGAEIAAVSALAIADLAVFGRALGATGPVTDMNFKVDQETPIIMEDTTRAVKFESDEPASAAQFLESTESMNILKNALGAATLEPLSPFADEFHAPLSITPAATQSETTQSTTETTTTTETSQNFIAGPPDSNSFFMTFQFTQTGSVSSPSPPSPPSPPVGQNIIFPSPGANGSSIDTLWFQNGPTTVNFIGQNDYFNFAALNLEADGAIPVYLSIDGVGMSNLMNNSEQLFVNGVAIDSMRVYPGDIHLSPTQNTPGYTTYISNDGTLLQINNNVATSSFVDVATDLNGDHGFIVTSAFNAPTASYFSTITDINGDGIGDLVMAATYTYDQVTVIFGSTTPFPAQLDGSTVGVDSIVFSGVVPGKVFGTGDFNGDGLNDLLIGSSFDTSAFVVFGQSSFPGSADLPTLAAGGGALEITTAVYFSTGGSSLGDINGDGLGDIALNNSINGNVYVVLGTVTPPTSIDVSTLNGTNGFTIVTSSTIDPSVVGMTFADINGDGFNDLIFKEHTSSPYAETVWTIFGKAGGFPAVIDTTTMSSGDGFAIIDSSDGTYHSFGREISNIGDFNHDGIDDVLIVSDTIKAYVIFGNPAFSSGTTFDVTTLDGTNGFTLTHSPDLFIQSAKFAGDVNGDGIADLVLGDYSAYGFEGAAYVIFGSDDPFPATVDMIQTDPTKGFTIHDYTGGSGLSSVGGGGDINGDGLSDIVLNANDIVQTARIVFGSNFSNTITIIGDDAVFVINGTSNDVIFAGTADHTINLGSGTNYVDTGTGNNTVNGGAGNDTIVYSALNISVDGAAATDTLYFKQDGQTADFTTAFNYSGIDVINLKAMQTLTGNKIILDPATVLRMSDNNEMTINGSSHEIVVLQANGSDNWTSSIVMPGYITYTSTSGSVVNVQNTLPLAPFTLSDNALDGINGFFIASSSTGDPTGLFGETIAVVYNAIGDGYNYLFINAPLGAGGITSTGEAFLVPGSTAVQPPSLTVDDASLNTITINSLTSNGPFFSIASLGGYTSAGANNLAFILGGGPPFANVLLDPINTLSASQDIATLNTISLFNGSFNSMFVAGIGDTNGDGLTDLALFSEWVPSIYIVFGTSTPVNIDLSTLTGTDGYQITNPNVEASDNIRTLISGNINGDGFNDVFYHYRDSITYADVVIAVLGQASNTSPISSATMIGNGEAFNITDSANPNTGFGLRMADIGNFHGSTADDLAIANPTTGTVYVLFGDATFNTSTTFDVSSLNGSNGFALTAPSGFEITAVGQVGDVNGDGYADMGVGTYNSSTFVSDLYVVFGHAGSFSPTLSLVPETEEDGLIIHHYGPSGANVIQNITGADFNGDGLSDIVYTNQVGLYISSPGGVNVIFGDNFSSHITIQADGSTPFVINGTHNDVIFAGANDHTINLGTGNNYVNPGIGNDIVNGGTGNDTIVFSDFLVSVSGSSGNDTLLFQQDGITEDLTATAIFTGIDTIDLKALLTNVGNKIELDAATISAMSDSNQMTINGGGMDVLTLSNNATDSWFTFGGGPPGYTTYFATAGPNAGTTIDVANTMQPVVLI